MLRIDVAMATSAYVLLSSLAGLFGGVLGGIGGVFGSVYRGVGGVAGSACGSVSSFAGAGSGGIGSLGGGISGLAGSFLSGFSSLFSGLGSLLDRSGRLFFLAGGETEGYCQDSDNQLNLFHVVLHVVGDFPRRPVY